MRDKNMPKYCDGCSAEIGVANGPLIQQAVKAGQVALDFLRDAVLRLEAAGYPHMLLVHDEIVVEVPEGFGSVEEVERIMGGDVKTESRSC